MRETKDANVPRSDYPASNVTAVACLETIVNRRPTCPAR